MHFFIFIILCLGIFVSAILTNPQPKIEFKNQGASQSTNEGYNVSLIEAAMRGNEQLVEWIVATWPVNTSLENINAVNDLGDTALHVAAHAGHVKIVRLLVQSGANTSIRNEDGKSPKDLAIEKGFKEIINLLSVSRRACDLYSNSPTTRIVDGEPADLAWMVALGYLDSNNNVSYDCGATIISDQFLLTAAHCIKDDRRPVILRIGKLSLTDVAGSIPEKFYIERFIRHPQYSRMRKKNDIALIQMVGRIYFSPKVRPACLYTDLEDVQPSDQLTISGWGRISNQGSRSQILLKANIQTMPLSQCNETVLEYSKNHSVTAFRNGISENQYCAFDPNGTKDSCEGDSGGPLQIIPDKGPPKVVGVVSFGIICGGSLPGIYTRVASYVDWIESYVWPNDEILPLLINYDTTSAAISAQEEMCQRQQLQCNLLTCLYGISKTHDENDCERCECENPCRGHQCPEGSKCVVDVSQNNTSFTPDCRKINKPGNCPSSRGNNIQCDVNCYMDADCRGDNKCCSEGCSRNCVPPESPQTTPRPTPQPTPPPTKQSTPQPPPRPTPQLNNTVPVTLEERTQNELNVIKSEGDVATLRCYVTGSPLPSISWKRDSFSINTNRGRYALTSNGDLLIVQTEKTDSGKYVCVANNGIGYPVEREIYLQIKDPVPIKPYTVVDKTTNSIKIVELNKPTEIRCLAGGYPKPVLTWFKGNQVLPFNSINLEMNRIQLSDLGTYGCIVNSCRCKPIYMYETLMAIGPVRAETPRDEQYLQYIISTQNRQQTPQNLRQTPSVVPSMHYVNKPGNCPNSRGNNIQCDVNCYTDADCHGDNKCCSEGCSINCLSPISTQPTSYYPQRQTSPVVPSIDAFVPDGCTDNEMLINCYMVVNSNQCRSPYYGKLCCRSCTRAYQMSSTYNTNSLMA